MPSPASPRPHGGPTARRVRATLPLLTVILTTVLAACSGGDGTGPGGSSAPRITTSTLAAGRVGVEYSATVSASGGDGQFTWTFLSGTFPPGLDFDVRNEEPNRLLIVGTPTQAGTYSFSVQARSGAGLADTAQLSIRIEPPEATELTITTSSLPDGAIGQTYTGGVNADGGEGTYTWAIVDGSLPPGLVMSADGVTDDDLVITGTPEEQGTFPFSLQVSVASGESDVAELQIVIAAAPGNVTVENPFLPPALQGASYTVELRASGGDGSYRWSVVEGRLPAGLSLTSAGAFEGTPDVADTVEITVQATSGGESGRQTFTLAVVAWDQGRYNITPLLTDAVPASLADNVAEAIGRWQQAITGDLEAIGLPATEAAGGFGPAGCLGFGRWLNGTGIDDLLVLVRMDEEASAGALGQAGTCAPRAANGLPFVGYVLLNRASLEAVADEEYVTQVVMHELAHAMGFGNLWPAPAFDLLAGADTDDPRYTGAEAIAAYQEAGGEDATIPVENEGGQGGQLNHWRESVFGELLMTSAVREGDANPLSRMTIAQFADLGYQVDLDAADAAAFFEGLVRAARAGGPGVATDFGHGPVEPGPAPGLDAAGPGPADGVGGW